MREREKKKEKKERKMKGTYEQTLKCCFFWYGQKVTGYKNKFRIGGQWEFGAFHELTLSVNFFVNEIL